MKWTRFKDQLPPPNHPHWEYARDKYSWEYHLRFREYSRTNYTHALIEFAWWYPVEKPKPPNVNHDNN